MFKMCLPCWPWTDIYLEEREEEKKEDRGVLAWDPNARSMVRVTGVKSVSIEHFYSIISLFIPAVMEYKRGVSAALGMDSLLLLWGI